jgi:hypothetical protein
MHLNATGILVLTALSLLMVGPLLVGMTLIYLRGYWHGSSAVLAALYLPTALLFSGVMIESAGLLERWQSSFFNARTFVCLILACFPFWLVVPLLLRKYSGAVAGAIASSKTQ